MTRSIRRLLATTQVTGQPVELVPGPDPQESRKRTRRSNILVAIAALMAIVFVAAVAIHLFVRPATLRIAVGPTASNDSRLVQIVAQALARERGQVRLKIIGTDGASASAAQIEQGRADLAIVRGDLALPKSAQAIAILRKNVVVMWTPASDAAKKNGKKAPAKAIEGIGDLAGRTVGIVGSSKANVELLHVILRQYGVGPDKVSVVQFSTGEVAEAIRKAKADVFLAAGPISSRITQDAINASSRGGAPKFLAIDAADAIAARLPAYEATDIAEGAFGSGRPDDTIKTIGFSHYVVARGSLPEQTATDFTRALFGARQAIAAELPDSVKIEAPDTDKDAALPAHPGAAAYIDGDEKTFFDRYSDLLYWGLMALSAVGSAGAWFASYMRRDEASAASLHRGRLLDLLLKARAAASADELDGLQAEADEVLRRTLEAFEAGAVEEKALAAFSIVLEQTHAAIADRRTDLARRSVMGPPSGPAAGPVTAQA